MLAAMLRPSESDVESLGVSGTDVEFDSEVPGAESSSRPTRSQLNGNDSATLLDLCEYGLILGADLQEPDMDWVVREAFEAPLPQSWTEHEDSEGRVYFYSQVTEESTWAHPMDGVYRELIILIQSFRAEHPAAAPASRRHAVKEHLEQAHRRAIEALEGWSGPYESETGPYFYNQGIGASTWVNPVEEWEYELAVQQSVLHRCLLPDFTEQSSADAGAGHGQQESLDPSIRLHMPLELAQPRDDDSHVSPMSSRSFYSARESSRSGHSERSLQQIREALQSPGRVQKAERRAHAERQNGERTPGLQAKLQAHLEEAAEGDAALYHPTPLKETLLVPT